jgi:ComF family protein
MIARLLHRVYTILHQTVFPPQCLVCRRFFQPTGGERSDILEDGGCPKQVLPLIPLCRLGSLLSGCLCQACIRQLVAVESPICTCCGLPFKSRRGTDHRCGECIAEPKKFRIARAPLVYEQILTRIIHRFKYKGKIQLADPLAELLLTAFRLLWDPESIDLILPVPLHLKKFRQRGFNQAYLLVRNWHTFAGKYPNDATDLQIERDLLVRSLPTSPQTAFGRAKRATNVKNAFDLNDADRVKDQRILLIDDVYTTGATVNECSRLLLSTGARHVDVLTLARAI